MIGKGPVELGNPLTAISIDLTENCSLRCTYCFADIDTENKKQRSKSKNKLTLKTGQEIINWLFRDDVTLPKSLVSIDWWGGEPLMEFELIKQLVPYAREKAKECGKKVRFGGTTNIISITEDKFNWLLDNEINLLFSCDGIGERNKHRILPTGENSWPIIEKNLEMIKRVYRERGMKPLRIRMTVTPDNIIGMADDIYKFYKDGWTEVFFSEDYEADWTESALIEYKKEIEKLSEYRRRHIDDDFLITKFLDDTSKFILDNAFTEEEKTTNHNGWSCGAGKTYLGVSTTGVIYPCHRFNKHNTSDIPIESKEFVLGTIYDNITNLDLYSEISSVSSKNPESLPHCESCTLLNFCHGGCIASCQDNTGKINGFHPYICIFKKIIYNVMMDEISWMIKNKKMKKYSESVGAIINTGNNKFLGRKEDEEKTCSCYISKYTNSVDQFSYNLRNNIGETHDDEIHLLNLINKVIEQELQKKFKDEKNNTRCLCNAGAYNKDNEIEQSYQFNKEQIIKLADLFNLYIKGNYNV